MKSSGEVRNRVSSTPWRGALCVFLAASALTVYSWRALIQREHQQLQHLVDVGATRIRSEIRTRLATRMGTLSILARDWQGRLLPTRSGWESDVRLALSQSPGLEAVEWIEPDGAVDWIYPREATVPPLRPAQLHVEHGPANHAFLVGPFEVAPGQPGLRILAPLVDSDEVAGWLCGSFRASALFSDVLENVAPSYEILLRSGTVVLARSAHFGAPSQRGFSRRFDLDLPGSLQLNLDVAPSQAMLDTARTRLPLVILAGGLAMSVLLALALMLRGIAAARADDVETLNQELEERVVARTTELERSNHDLERYASFLSHELRRPISTHTIWAELLESRYGNQLEEPFRTYLAEIRSGARRMSDLISAQLELSTAAAAEPEPNSVDLTCLVREVQTELKADLERTGGTVRAGPLPVVRVDARQLRQLVRNLLENGIKFRRAGVPPEIEVSFQRGSPRREDAVEVRFRDNGRGFSSDEAHRVFRFSERLDPDGEPGNGLGLALCAHIASRLGGEIYADGEPGMGATFHVVLPREILVEDRGES